ncbi:unnamed protein product [Caenorhabditis angaria]|uniref:Domain of unknown function DB domain-containing protein n=1 Tax=Caenorhabditis angaria TaxID=860376 RepID=A0A9P1IE00_9PELO|nr:unnamed protein product [Caenorhabditis angaria]
MLLHPTIFVVFMIFSQILAKSANEKLQACCAHDPGIDRHCAQKYCNFVNINQFQIFPFIAECKDKGNTISKIWDCISSKHNHVKCCENQGVLPLCREFCDATKAVPTDILKYGFCTAEFDKYRMCFRTYLKHNNAIRQ